MIGRCISSKSLLLTAVFSLAALANAADETTVDTKAIPEQVLAAFAKEFPDFEIASVEKEEIDGTSYYEIEIKDDKIERDIVFLEDGTLYSVEEEIASKDLPMAVMDAVKKAWPKGEVDEAEKITKESEVEFEIVVELTDGDNETEYEMIVAADGKIIQQSQLADDDEDEGEDDEDSDDFGDDEEDED